MNKEVWDSLTVAEKLGIAIANAQMLHLRGPKNPSYLSDTLAARTDGPSRTGSFFRNDFLGGRSLVDRLFLDYLPEWEEYRECPNLGEGCVAFKLSLSSWDNSHNGGYGVSAVYAMIDLVFDVGRYDDGIKLEVIDPKNTGYANFVYHMKDEILPMMERIGGLPVSFAVAIVEMAERDREGNLVEHAPILATVHPGDPVWPSRIKLDESGLKPGQRISIADAKKLGVRYVKIV